MLGWRKVYLFKREKEQKKKTTQSYEMNSQSNADKSWVASLPRDLFPPNKCQLHLVIMKTKSNTLSNSKNSSANQTICVLTYYAYIKNIFLPLPHTHACLRTSWQPACTAMRVTPGASVQFPHSDLQGQPVSQQPPRYLLSTCSFLSFFTYQLQRLQTR